MTIGVKILLSDLWCQDQSRFKLFLFYRCIFGWPRARGAGRMHAK